MISSLEKRKFGGAPRKYPELYADDAPTLTNPTALALYASCSALKRRGIRKEEPYEQIVAELRQEINGETDEEAKDILYQHLLDKEVFKDAKLEVITDAFQSAKSALGDVSSLPDEIATFLTNNQNKSVPELKAILRSLEYAVAETKFIIGRDSILNPEEMALDTCCVLIFEAVDEERKIKKRRPTLSSFSVDIQAAREDVMVAKSPDVVMAKSPAPAPAPAPSSFGGLFGSKK